MANTNKSTNPKKNSEFPELESPELQSLAKCMATCTACCKKCTEEGQAENAALCRECADICTLAIRCTLNESEFQEQVLNLCSEICNRCADENENMKSSHCKECAQACRECAEACRVSEYNFK